MNNNWIIDVLTDLRRFATLNDMPGLAEELDQTAYVAAMEIANATGQQAVSTSAQPQDAGTLRRHTQQGREH